MFGHVNPVYRSIEYRQQQLRQAQVIDAKKMAHHHPDDTTGCHAENARAGLCRLAKDIGDAGLERGETFVAFDLGAVPGLHDLTHMNGVGIGVVRHRDTGLGFQGGTEVEVIHLVQSRVDLGCIELQRLDGSKVPVQAARQNAIEGFALCAEPFPQPDRLLAAKVAQPVVIGFVRRVAIGLSVTDQNDIAHACLPKDSGDTAERWKCQSRVRPWERATGSIPRFPLDACRPFAETRAMGAASLIIDLDAIAANWRALDAKTSDHVETGAVVKADGYGLDVVHVARRLKKEGVQSYFTAVVEEGRAVRNAVGDGPDIYVFSGHMDGDTEALRGADLIPLLNSPDQVARHFSLAPGHGFGVQLDTGMNRLGMEPADWTALRGDLMEAGPRLVMSHLACADEPAHPMNAQQLRTFRDMTDGVSHRRSLAATGGILLGPEYHFDLVRPGVGLYGGLPYADATPVVRLTAPVIQVRTVRPFETVGYGNTWTATVETEVATIAAGYADGLFRAMAPDAHVYAGDTPCKVIGRVSMDLVTVDVSHLDDVPDTLEILGAHQGVDDLAAAAGTIGYEILTSLGQRYDRRYEGAA